MRASHQSKAILALLSTLICQFAFAQTEDDRPNLLLIMVDDMGYTDIGAYGSEINTPVLDQLAKEGLLMTDFHNQAVCRPTRSALMGGTDSHNAGGGMHQAVNQRDEPGYESVLNDNTIAFPSLLQAAGYNTYFTGKWHLGNDAGNRPSGRGFDRSFALLPGMASHYHDASFVQASRKSAYSEDGVDVEKLPEDFYSTTFYTDYIIDAIEKDRETGAPWFTYLAYTAPHWPLQAPPEYIAKYEGMYDEGYDVLREKRIEASKAAGIFPADAKTYPQLDIVEPWDTLSDEEKKVAVREMEIYAAMVDFLDESIGRLVDYLKSIDEYENTVIVFLTDNGAEGQIRNPGGGGDGGFDTSYENMGKINSYVHYRTGWAEAAGSVMRYFKSFSSEGGIRGQAIFHYPKSGVSGVKSDQLTSVIDIAATFVDMANAPHPQDLADGKPVHPLQGKSLRPLIMGETDIVRTDDDILAWEVFGHLAVRKGDWKLLQLATKSSDSGQRPAQEAGFWGLYDMATDPGETTDLSDQNPEVVEELLAAWDQYSSNHGLIIPIVDDTSGAGGGGAAMGGGMGGGMGGEMGGEMAGGNGN